MKKQMNGSCLCGAVKYSVDEGFDAFYLCHCEQCQKVTGSAFASNILTSVDNIEWLSGEDKVVKYQDMTRDFSKAFCGICGAGVPYVNRKKTHLVIPAGSLNSAPSNSPEANLFKSESPYWLTDGLAAKNFKGFPD
jgi:hypothetical protein